MKKLLIVASIALSAVVTNAASYVWGFSTPATAPGKEINWETGEGALTTGTAMLFIGTIGQTKNDNGTYTLDFTKATYIAKSGLDMDTFTFGEQAFDSSRVSSDVSAAEKQVYTLILFEDSDVTKFADYDGKYFAYSGESALTQDAETSTDYANFITGTAIGGKDWRTAGTASVPEPTSGLLLLLGLAGLALKRKQA